MKALVYTAPQRLELREMPEPIPDRDEVVVRVEAAGICGSDMHAYLGHDERRPPPLILGHEAAGVVVSGVREGACVTINPLVTCGRCGYCRSGRDNLCTSRQIISMLPRQGALAELVVIPERNLIELPKDFPFDKAAMTEPLACGWHAVKRAQAAAPSSLATAKCLVIGGGAIGLGAALALRAHGAHTITIAEKNEPRRTALQKMNSFTLVASAENARVDANGYPIVVDSHGDQSSRRAASRLVAPGGVILHIGLAAPEGGLDARRITLQEITLMGTYTYTMQDFRETFAAMTSGELGQLDWFEPLSLKEGPAAFEALLKGDFPAPKVILRP